LWQTADKQLAQTCHKNVSKYPHPYGDWLTAEKAKEIKRDTERLHFA